MKPTFTPAAFAALVTAAVFAAGCGPDAERRAADTRPAVQVRVLHPAAGAADALVLPARVTAREEITLTARMAARLTALPVREGDRFRAGQALARFDAPETRAALAGADAGLAAATLARDLARKQESRMDSLYAGRVAALRELEGAQADRRAAEAGWAQARAQADQFRSGTTISAPFDGVVVRRHADIGVTVGPGQPLLDVRSAGDGEITASVPEAELPRLTHARAEVQVGDGPWAPATVLRVDGMTDFATRSRVARFRAGTGGALEPGAFARVRLGATTGANAHPGDPVAGVLSVPSGALVRRGSLAGVYVAESGIAHLRWLRIGRESGGRIEVLAGLDAADAVIENPAGLEDGRAVSVRP